MPIINHILFSSGFFTVLSPLQAQAVTLTVAQAFKVALDLWEIAQEGKNREENTATVFLFFFLKVYTFTPLLAPFCGF